MIIEGLLTTTNDDGAPHVAPMGPVVDPELDTWLLRPFQTSTTFQWLRERPVCGFHVVDDVLTVVKAVLGEPLDLEFEQLDSGTWIIASACHWYELCVVEWDISDVRSEARAVVQRQQVRRPFWGWNRAKHAILEATILMTRLHLLDRQAIQDDFQRFESAIDKTGGPRELQAWSMLKQYLEEN